MRRGGGLGARLVGAGAAGAGTWGAGRPGGAWGAAVGGGRRGAAGPAGPAPAGVAEGGRAGHPRRAAPLPGRPGRPGQGGRRDRRRPRPGHGPPGRRRVEPPRGRVRVRSTPPWPAPPPPSRAGGPPSWSSAGCCSTSGCGACCAARAWPRRPSGAPSSGWPRARAAAGSWFARVTGLPGRGSLIRFGHPDAPAFQLAAADPEAAPALPAALEPALRELCEGLGWSVVRLVEDALPALDPVRRRVPGADDEGAFLAWAYTLAVDEALDRLAARGLLTPPPPPSPRSASPTRPWPGRPPEAGGLSRGRCGGGGCARRRRRSGGWPGGGASRR